MKAFRIVNWKELAEVTRKGKVAKNSDKNLKKGKPMYVRWAFQSHCLDPRYKRLARKAYSIGKMMEAACIGLYALLMDIARDFNDPNLRGWVLDDLKRPMDPDQIADHLEMRDKSHVAAALDLLCDPEVGLMELVDFDVLPESGGKQGETGGKLGKAEEPGRSEGDMKEAPYIKETKTEYEEKIINETEDGGMQGKDGQSTPAPASALVSGSDSERRVSVSDSVPRQGRGYSIEEVRILRQKAHLELTEIIRPRTTGDNTTFVDIMEQLAGRMISETDEDLFTLALAKARQCRRLDKPIAAFVAAMKKSPFYYQPKGTQIIKGALDKYHGERTRRHYGK